YLYFYLVMRLPPTSTLFPYTTLFRSENLRRAYGDLGYINFVSIPNTNFEDEEKLMLDIDLDEGKQFYIGSVNILGLDEPVRQERSEERRVGKECRGRRGT